MSSENPEPSAQASSDGHQLLIERARGLFPVATLQDLDPENAARCQALLGHGSTLGIWETPEWMTGGRAPFRFQSRARIVLRERLLRGLAEPVQPSAALDVLLDEGVLRITRYLLLIAMGPAHLVDGKSSLDCTSIVTVTDVVDELFSQGILRRLEQDDRTGGGLLRHLTANDLQAFDRNKGRHVELVRLRKLTDLGLWNDPLPALETKRITNPKGKREKPKPETKSIPYQPIPDDYLSEMGPRVLWIVEDLGPNIIHLSEAIPELFEGIGNYNEARVTALARYFRQHTWRDREGRPITAPPFPLVTATGKGYAKGKMRPHWPPSSWEQVKVLAATLQSAHLWIALLAMAGRISEVETLERCCVEWRRDGKPYVDGKTYKLKKALAGVDRDWPAPVTLIHALGQQARLVAVWERIARALNGADLSNADSLVVDPNHLWASLGTSSSADPVKRLSGMNKALQMLAKRIGLSDRPGGVLLHSHRFRKTVARLAGIAIVDSPRVLMQLLGHKDIEVTLHYITTDKALAADIERVARELRIMRSQEVFEGIRASMQTGTKKYGGGGVPGVEAMIRQAKDWGAETSYELSVLLTANGRYTRLVRPGVICLKPSLNNAPCTCDSSCENRIERLIDDEVQRRDVLTVIPILIEEGNRAVDENSLLAAEDKLRQIDEELGWLGEDAANEFAGDKGLGRLREALA
ncbi:MAG: integrase family protein [Proteobacteria bacterium]|nr:integrase family protein [Pseudomonadota bacterium]